MRSYLIMLLGAVILCAGCSDKPAPNSQPEAGHTSLGTPVPPVINPANTDNLQYLTQYVGQNPDSAGLWKTEPLKTRLQELLEDDFPKFIQLMQHASPLRQERVLYTIGKNDSTNNSAFLLVDLENNNLHVSIIEDGIRKQYQPPGEEPYIPYAVEKHL